MTSKQQKIYNGYLNSNLYDLYDCYNYPSRRKVWAYNECVEKCEKMNGYDFKIIGYNTSMFSIGFLYNKDGKTYLHYETHVSVLDFVVSDEETKAYDYEDFKRDYDGLSDETKKHLANSGVMVNSMQQAKEVMDISKAFDILFKVMK